MTTSEPASDREQIQPPTREGLVESITGLPMVMFPHLITDEFCKRCDQMNDVRLRYGLPQRDAAFSDGERVTLILGYVPDPDPDGWTIRGAHHVDHPMRAKADVALANQAVAEVTARLDRTGWTYEFPNLGGSESSELHVEERSVVRDVEIVWFSPVGEGKEERERITPVDENGIAHPKEADPKHDWPAETNEWHRQILETFEG